MHNCNVLIAQAGLQADLQAGLQADLQAGIGSRADSNKEKWIYLIVERAADPVTTNNGGGWLGCVFRNKENSSQ